MNNFTKTQEALAEAVKIDKSKVTAYQAAQHQKGNKITWQQAMDVFTKSQKDVEKERKRLAAVAKRAEKKLANAGKPKPKKGLTDAQFRKIMKDAASDFQADFGDDSPHELGDVAWDIAGSLMYDADIDAYVRKTMAKNIGRRPEEIRRERVQEFIADYIV